MSILNIKIWAHDLGFTDIPADLRLDGTIKRFGKKDRRWYIGNIIHTINAKDYEVFTVGDWQQGSKHTYKPNVTLTNADKASLNVIIKQQAQAQEDEKRKDQLKAEINSKKLWESASSENVDTHPYIIKKQIAGLNSNIKIVSDFDKGDTLLIPMFDKNFNMVGIQRIFEDSKKLFMYGQQTSECFFVFGELDKDTTVAYVCEGFATGASIYKATGKTVICTFNASNLPKVCRFMVTRYTATKFIVCGDDDFETKENVGVKYGNEAAIICCTKAVYPIFIDRKSGDTDFNDLHVKQGINVVTDQLADVIDNDIGYSCLGYDKSGFHYFYQHEAKTIFKMNRFMSTDMFLLAPIDYWESLYPKGEKGGIDWDEARSNIIEKSTKHGLYDSTRERGVGVWVDENRFILNTGNGIFNGTKRIDMSSLRTRKFYVASETRITANFLEILPTSESRKVFDIASKFKWVDKSSPYFLSGWIALSRVCGALPVRPNVWVTGSKGTGKSTVLNEFATPLLGSSGYVKTSGNTTEAGLRSMLRRGAMPVIFDEFEVENADSFKTLNSVIQLIRQSWSGESKIFKGTPTGGLIQYTVIFMTLVASIRVSLVNDADKSRFCVLDLKNNNNDMDWPSLEREIYNFVSEDVGNKLFARSYLNLDKILESYRILHQEISLVANQRKGQQIGMLLAGYWSLISDNTINIDQARNLIKEINYFEDKNSKDVIDVESDEYELLNYLLTTKIRISNKSTTGFDEVLIQECLQISDTVNDYSHIQNELRKYGMKFSEKENALFICNSHRELERLLQLTKWAKDWKKTLMRLPDSKQTRTRFFGKYSKFEYVTRVDLSKIYSENLNKVTEKILEDSNDLDF